MTQRWQVYRCEVCGNLVMVLHKAGGTLVCCGQPMSLLEENGGGVGREKHLPVLAEKSGGVLEVTVGSLPHPMTEEHYIEWIELATEDGCCRRFLQPGEEPRADFRWRGRFKARAYCNLHGLWKG